jgi:hypothetical protein
LIPLSFLQEPSKIASAAAAKKMMFFMGKILNGIKNWGII